MDELKTSGKVLIADVLRLKSNKKNSITDLIIIKRHMHSWFSSSRRASIHRVVYLSVKKIEGDSE